MPSLSLLAANYVLLFSPVRVLICQEVNGQDFSTPSDEAMTGILYLYFSKSTSLLVMLISCSSKLVPYKTSIMSNFACSQRWQSEPTYNVRMLFMVIY